MKSTFISLWHQLYPDADENLLHNFIQTIEVYRQSAHASQSQPDWYKDAVVYSLYVDLFNHDFEGLTRKLPYLQSLGVNCLWLLPILDSPMRDAGFDIKDFFNIRPDLTGTNGLEIFRTFLDKAHQCGIYVIFDVAINHCSEELHWFREAKKGRENPYRNYFIWSDDASEFKEARIIFKGIEESNWERCGDAYYFHRFFNFQPDLNYKNPEVLFAMCRTLLYWQATGVDGFRADAIPYLWKEAGTDCENLPQTHAVVKFFRAILDYVKPGTLLLAEACQQPKEVVAYLGNGDECHAAYHFPLMPRIYKALAMQSGKPIEETLDPNFTPPIPAGTQWFTFLRCHDELSLELVYVTEEERKYIHENYCLDKKWDFRLGEGIAARLSELLSRDERKILLAYSIMLSLPGTPVIYYGDDVAKLNDESYYEEQIKLNGKDDTRFLVRGKMNWPQIEKELTDPGSLAFKVNSGLKQMLGARNQYKAFGRGRIEFLQLSGNKSVLAYLREYQNEKLLCVHNLSHEEVSIQLPENLKPRQELLGKPDGNTIEALGYRWFVL